MYKKNFIKLQNVFHLYIQICILGNERLFFDVFINLFLKSIEASSVKQQLIYCIFETFMTSIYEKKNQGRSTAYKAEAIPISKQKQALGGVFQKQLSAMQLFLHFSKPEEMPVTYFILVVYLSVPAACYFTKG